VITRCWFAPAQRYRDRRRILFLAASVVLATTVGAAGLPPLGWCLLAATMVPIGLVLPLAAEEPERERALAVLGLAAAALLAAAAALLPWRQALVLALAVVVALPLLAPSLPWRPASARPLGPALTATAAWGWSALIPAAGLVAAIWCRPVLLQSTTADPLTLASVRGTLAVIFLMLAATARPWTVTASLLGLIAAFGLAGLMVEAIDGDAYALLLAWYAIPVLALEPLRAGGRHWPLWLVVAGLLWLAVPGAGLVCLGAGLAEVIFAGVLLLVLPGVLAVCRWRPPRAGAPPSLRRATAGLPPAWRWYLRGKLRRDPVYLLLARQPRPFGRVLDAGCGPALGGAVAVLRGDATAYHGIDLDAGKLELGRLFLAGLGRPLDDAWRLSVGHLPADLPADLADTILALDLLHYWPPAAQGELLTALAARLAPGGVCYLREGLPAGPAAGVVRGERCTTALGLNPATGGLHFPSRAELLALIAAAGLAVEAEWPAGTDNVLFRLASAAPRS
jgi:SAM-dependent methyltransferase